jgi:hypothetical protein
MPPAWLLQREMCCAHREHMQVILRMSRWALIFAQVAYNLVLYIQHHSGTSVQPALDAIRERVQEDLEEASLHEIDRYFTDSKCFLKLGFSNLSLMTCLLVELANSLESELQSGKLKLDTTQWLHSSVLSIPALL